MEIQVPVNEKFRDLEGCATPNIPGFKDGLYQPDTRRSYRSRIPLSATSFCTFVLRLIASFLFLAVIAKVLVPRMNYVYPSSVHQTVQTPRSKALVISSMTSQDVSWLQELDSSWDIYRYIMDDEYADLHNPVNAGREAMTYLTYIIDHYYSLPDYVVFIHGHERGWHQPEPMQWRLPTLNLDALDRDQYISFNCVPLLKCDPESPRMNLTAGYHDLDTAARLIPWFYRHAEISDEVPESMSWPDAAQFAVTKTAILRRSRDWWIRYRDPMLKVDPKLELFHSPNYYWGLIHERLWHVAFGMEPNHCPDPNYCLKVQWSNGVLCDRYPHLPMNKFFNHDDALAAISCFKNEDREMDWEIKTISACDNPDYLATGHARCPFEGWDLP